MYRGLLASRCWTLQKIRELQNDIHAVQVQWKEADHVRDMYRNVRKSLSDDAARFGSNIKKIEEEIQAQYADIEGLQKVTATLDIELCAWKPNVRRMTAWHSHLEARFVRTSPRCDFPHTCLLSVKIWGEMLTSMTQITLNTNSLFHLFVLPLLYI